MSYLIKDGQLLSAVSVVHLLCNLDIDIPMLEQLKYQRECRMYNAYFPHITI